MKSIKKIFRNELYWFAISVCFLLIGTFTSVDKVAAGIGFAISYSIGLVIGFRKKK